MKRKIRIDNDKDWLVTFSDVVTLLMAFFVLLLAMSTIDQNKIEQMQQGLEKDIFKKETQQPFSHVKHKLTDIVERENLQDHTVIENHPLGLQIQFSSSVIYDIGSAEIKKEMMPVLQSITNAITDAKNVDYMVNVEGHTDDIPIRTEQFPSNWELSAARATHVVRFMIKNGIPKERFKATGLADSKPLLPNRDADGVAIPENQSANRRIVLYIIRTHT